MGSIDQQDDIDDRTVNLDGSIYFDAQTEQEERQIEDDFEMGLESDSESVMVAKRGADLVSDSEDDNISGTDLSSSLSPNDYIQQLKSSDQIHDFARLIACTLASVPEGCQANRLRSLLQDDWSILADYTVQDLGYPSFDVFLASDFMKDHIEIKNIINNSNIYAVKVTPSIQHITQTLADQNLSADQIKMKRKQQRLLELKKVENTEAFIEGKRRILTIMMDLHGYERPVSHSLLQTEYERRYGVVLNPQEQSRMFTNKSASKNIRRVFYNEIDIVSQNPLFLKLKSSSIKLPEEISEEDRLRAVGIEDVELPSFPTYETTKVELDKKNNGQPVTEQTKTDEPRLDTHESNGHAETTMNWDEEEMSDGSDANEDEKKLTDNKENDRKISGGGGFASVSKTKASTEKKLFGVGGTFTSDESDDESNEGSDGASTIRSTRHSRQSNRPVSSSMKDSSVKQSTSTVELVEPESKNNHNGNPLNGQLSQMKSSDSKSVELPLLSQLPRRKGITERSLIRSIEESESNWTRPQPSSKPSQESYRKKIELQRDNYNVNQHETPLFSSRQNNSEDRDTSRMNNASSERAYREQQIGERVNRGGEVGMSYLTSATASNRSSTPQSRIYPAQCFKGFRDGDTPENENYKEDRLGNRQNNRNMQSSSRYADKKDSDAQTESDWLESLLEDLGIDSESGTSAFRSPSNFGFADANRVDEDILSLAQLIEFAVRVHTPKPVLISELPEIVEKVYGYMINPSADRKYRLSWTALIERYCSNDIKLARMPNNEVILCYKRNS